MDDALLNLGFREAGTDGVRESGQIIDTNDQNVLYSTIFQFVQDGQPELAILGFSDPHAHNVLVSIHVETVMWMRR